MKLNPIAGRPSQCSSQRTVFSVDLQRAATVLELINKHSLRTVDWSDIDRSSGN